MIRIRSNKELTFNTVSRQKGIVTVSIESYTRNPKNKTFTLHILDTVEYYVMGSELKYFEASTDAEGNIVDGYYKEVEKEIMMQEYIKRVKTYSDAELLALAKAINFGGTITSDDLIDITDDLFQQGLLLMTQQECIDGRGIYMSDYGDWEIPVED